MTHLNRLRTILVAADTDQTIAFYESIGFEVIGRMGDDPEKPFWFQVKRDNVQLMFTYSEPHTHDGGELHVDEPALAGSLYIDLDDVDALFKELDPAPAIVIYEPADQPHGMREFALRDPNGYALIFGAPTG